MSKNNNKRKEEVNAHKSDYTPIFRAFNGAFKRYQGGATAIADALGRNDSTVRNMFSPNTDCTPSLPVFFRTIELMPDHTVMNAICALADGHFVPNDAEIEREEDVCGCALSSMSSAAKLIQTISRALEDGNISLNEADAILTAMEELRDVEVQLRNTLLSIGNKKAAGLTTAQTKQIVDKRQFGN